VDKIEEFVDVERLVTTVLEFLPRLGAAIVIFLLFLVVYRVTRIPIRAGLERTGLHEKLIEMLVFRVYRYVIVLVGAVMAADQLGINVAAALAGMGVAGIAIGFAAQDSVANFISGILIFWDKPFVVGDWIKTEGEHGRVTNITLRTTRIRTNRNTFIVIPNKRIIDEVLENYSKHGEMRVDASIGIAYKEDIGKARDVLLAAIDELDLDPPKQSEVVVEELGGSSVNLSVRVWIADAAQQPATLALVLEAGKRALDDAGIQIPFPHLQLMVDDVAEPVWAQFGKIAQGGRAS